jgi:RNase P subunit RPR2
MKVIKRGKINDLKRFDCQKCSSVVEMSRNEMTSDYNPGGENYYTWKCPVCFNKNVVNGQLVIGTEANATE